MPYTWSVDKATNWICSGAETLGSFRGRIRDAAYIRAAGLNARAWCSREPVPFTKRKTGPGKPLEVGKRWGRNFDCAWIHFTGRVPESAAGKAVALKIELGGEGCVFDNTGRPVQGLTNVWTRGPWDEGKMIVDISSRAKGGDPIDLWVDAGANGLFGYSEEQNGGKLNIADICVCNPEMKALFYDFVTLHDLSDQLEDRSARRHQILGALFDAILVLRDFTNAEAKRARAILKPELKKRNGDASLVVSAIGHAHLDLSWLWPERETYRKGARTFATVLHFMQKYPDYAFGASQPQLYQWIKDKYPSLYSGIKKRVAEGRWEAQGALWVESDTNVPCCESLVRQILYGKRFFRDEFGKDMKITYLPDVFGYSAALPQIMKKAGVPYFMTQKMSWSTRNKFPHHTFHWQGIDGSTVLSHMLPNNNYNADVSPSTVMECERNYADKMVSDRSLMLFGIGDGGGGPGEGHLERLARSKNLAGMPPVVQESALAFFRRIEKDKGRYARWQGELYLEQHRGTYTSQAYCKAYNRKMEIALRDLELAAGLAGRLAGARYPRKELEALWKEVLLYQFHDILPGSSIKRAYDETYARYRVILKETRALARKAKGALLNRIDRKGRAPVVVVNQLSWRRHEWVKAGRRWLKAAVPSMGHAVADGSVREKMPKTVCCSERALENDLLRIRFDKDGWITSIFDKQNKREAIAGGEKANKLVLFDDTADAWNLQQDYHHRPPRPVRLIKTAARIDGPRGIVTQTRVYGKRSSSMFRCKSCL
jgi:alpha-mannosidase